MSTKMVFLSSFIFFMLWSFTFSITTNDFYTIDESLLNVLEGDDESVLVTIPPDPPLSFFGNVSDSFWVSIVYLHVCE